MKLVIKDVMQSSGVKFGTSGARGLADEMTDLVCYTYTQGFLQYLESIGELVAPGTEVAIAGDFRPSTGRIMTAVARAVGDMGYKPLNCGRIPSPAVALYGINHSCPAIMVTGSHIPSDRNGIKFNKASGEVLKTDEAGITSQIVDLVDGLFNADGSFASESALPAENKSAGVTYVNRYLNVFPADCLHGKKIGIYQHSAVGRELLVDVFNGLGADVVALGWSDTFIPVDTEAIREEDVALARQWAAEYEFDAIFSTDGDSDRPLISDENGEWLRGDIAGILAATYLKADSVSTPVSCNTALEKSNRFKEIRRTRIGSPFVIVSMIEAAEAGRKGIVGYEANGGFLTNSAFTVFDNELPALPTRDAVLPMLNIMLLSMEKGIPVAQLVAELPQRFTLSDRIQDFPPAESAKIIERFKEVSAIESVFSDAFGKVASIDRTDGLRITFESEEVLHMRPSGNAPEFRCYNEAGAPERVLEIQKLCMDILIKMKGDAQ